MSNKKPDWLDQVQQLSIPAGALNASEREQISYALRDLADKIDDSRGAAIDSADDMIRELIADEAMQKVQAGIFGEPVDPHGPGEDI